MKKLLLIGAALAACAPFAFAQEADSSRTDAKDRLEKIEQLADMAKEKKAGKSKKFFDYEMVHRLGYGSHLMEPDEFNQDYLKSREIWFNAFDLVLNPAPWFSASLGVNLKWDRFLAAGDYYIYADATDGNTAKFAPIATQQALYPAAGGNFKKLSSQVNLFSLEAPLLIGFSFGDLGLKLGAQAVVPLTAKQIERAEYANTKVRSNVGKLNKSPFYYGFYGELNYSELGVYAKYSPAEILPGTVQDLITIGLVLGF
ncbi:MAG: hypothetical protein K6F58_06685 [Bacteroidales bacterium]|nr:hypothetical protein [Bacteroidales bacterium]